MDLGAYDNIENLEYVIKNNNIIVPRLRGLRLMKNEEQVSQTRINDMKKHYAVEVAENLCRSSPFWSPYPDYRIYDGDTDDIADFFLIKSINEFGNDEYVDINWNRIHGKKRKILKLSIKKKNRMVQSQYDIWNKYAGKDNILYIHSRIGGVNWELYRDSVIGQPWFIEKVDDCFDDTYCDIYAKIH